MVHFLLRHWKVLAVASLSVTSSYVLCHHDHFHLQTHHLVNSIAVRASDHGSQREQKLLPKLWKIESRKAITIGDDDDDDDDNDDDENRKDNNDDSNRRNAKVENIRQNRFHEFASVQYNGEIYMTPLDFLESVVAERPRPRIGRRQLTEERVDSILNKTPPKNRGSTRFFRNLEDAGLISYAEYLFLWVILTRPTTQFEIAFAMFDTDGNQLVDKSEFLVLGRVMSDKRMINRQSKSPTLSNKKSATDSNNRFMFDDVEHINTTLLIHFFGKNGRDTLNYKEFKRFMENLQMEILEIEFAEFSHGFKTISDLDFAEMLLRYTNFDYERKRAILKRVKKYSDSNNAVTFDEFKHFSMFLANLEEFSIAMRFHRLSNKPISQAEFQRAVKISMGFELEPHLIALIFRIFDANDDKHLSYDEFIAVMKDRLSRHFQTFDNSEGSSSRFDQFKRCIRDQAKYDTMRASA